MKFKLDENLGRRTQDSFRNAGHDVGTVSEEKLCGASDERSSRRVAPGNDAWSVWTSISPTPCDSRRNDAPALSSSVFHGIHPWRFWKCSPGNCLPR
jgi:hypothetical protein